MFSRRWLINYLLFTLIIIFTWIGLKYPIREDQKIIRNSITQMRPQDITRIKIETADAVIRLQKKGSRWLITDPIQWFGNNITAERLTTLATLEATSELPRDQIKLSTLGLSIPRAVVMLNDQSIYFGNTNQIGNRRYLLVDDKVYLSSDIHFPFIAQGLSGLVDGRLLPASLDVKSIKSASFSLQKQSSNWISDNPGHPPEAIQALLRNWQTLPASAIRAYDDSHTPLHKVIVTSEKTGTIEFFVLSIQPEIILARPDLKLQYHFPEHQYYTLLSLDGAHE